MYYPYDDEHPEQAAPESTTSTPQADTTDRVNGEYHYKNGYTQKIYSDAHYVREDESTVPPKYYTPPEKPVKEAKEPKAQGSGSGWVKIVCVALICALLGGFAGGAIMNGKYSDRMNQLESQLAELSNEEKQLVVSTGSAPAVSGIVTGIPASSVYDMACQQVVGISSEITYSNFFGMTSSAAVSGSGFIASSDGYIITNSHVILNSKSVSVQVKTYDGELHDAVVVGFDKTTDLAVLKIDGTGYMPAEFGDSNDLRMGQWVVAIGNPGGEQFSGSITRGVISGLNRSVGSYSSNGMTYIQTDAAINPGNSGGPLVNLHGQVIGISSAKIVSEQYEGMGFAIPITGAKSIIDDLLAGGYVQGRVRFGIKGTAITQMQAAMYDVPQGFMISEIDEDSCFNGTDVQAYDIITAIDDTETKSLEELANALLNYKPGDTAEIHLFRPNESGVGGEEFTVTVTLLEDKGETQG